MGKRIRALISETAETLSGALGHGAVATYPDRPYLRWNFNYEESNASSRRDNQVTYLEACEALHNVFSQFAANAPKAFSDPRTARPFSAIKETVAGVLGKEAVCDDRISAWQKAAREGKLYDPAEGAIPSYEGGAWEAKLKAFKGKPAPTEATELTAYRFYQAASRHRHTVLREILPAHGIVVV